ncbi:Imm61 family immunity protein [Mycolicibacterium frederiksbergense]|uniref:Imm61 family immunity protein n=1 Tax=Mycolicibacterium frederiksbergense TaxID=117567 RepID=UPI00399A27A2
MRAPNFSAEIADLARRAGFALTPEDDSGAALFWSDPGGEIRFYVRGSADIGFTMTRAERKSHEQFELFTTSISVLERHLTAKFLGSIRYDKHWQHIVVPLASRDLAGGCRLSDEDADGYRDLFAPSGELLARARGGLVGIATLVELSHLLQQSVLSLERIYANPDSRSLIDE